MGDSLTDPRSHGGKYLDVLRARCPKSSFVSFGKGGNMVSMMLKRFEGELYGLDKRGDPPRYTHIVLLGGLGDVLSNEGGFRTPEKVAKDITAMVEIGRAHGAKVLLLTLPPWGGMKAHSPSRAKFTDDVNVWLEAEMKLGHFDGLFDTRPLLACEDPKKLCEKFAWPDRIHWSKEGHDVVGDALQRAMFADCE